MKHARLSALGLLIFATCSALCQDVKVIVDDVIFNFEKEGPIVNRNRVLVPMRSVFERLGAIVRWSPAKRGVEASKGPTYIFIQPGLRFASINGKTVALDAGARNVLGVTYVPLRFVSQAIGASVWWNAGTRTVTINSRQTDGMP